MIKREIMTVQYIQLVECELQDIFVSPFEQK